MRIAALLTCFNRKEKTLKCLRSLFKILPDCEVYLVDDASNDGTSAAVSNEFPQVHVIRGTGNLFWSRGMYTAWKEAIKGKYDFYLWLNDDIELYPFFFEELMACCQSEKCQCVVSGIIENFEKTEILYGGADAKKQMILPNGKPQEITFMNGNVVLVPSEVVKKIGIIDPVLHHDLGDVDYGLTARENGIKVLSTTRPVAAGYRNDFCRIRKWGVSFRKRFKCLYSPLGSHPRIAFYYRRKHFGMVRACCFVLYLYVLNILPDRIVTLIWGNAYVDSH